MYELRPESIRTFISDPTIELPRFQRKSTWTPKQNFNLVLSVYRGFPVGVFVIKKDSIDGTTKRYLLDGRQRRNALRLMQDPEEIYRWARSAMRFKALSDVDEISERFAEYRQTFLGEEEWERKATEPQEEAASLEQELGAAGDFDLGEYADDLDDAELEQDDAESEKSDEKVDGSSDDALPSATGGDLADLLRALLVIHPIRGRTTGVTRAFDYRQYLDGLPYVRPDVVDGKDYVVGRQVLNWLESKRRSHDTSDFPSGPDALAGWLLEDTRLLPSKSETALRDEVALRWDRSRGIFRVLRRLEDLSLEGAIGYLEIRDSSPNDERKIFEIINSAGTPLTAVEILSARPSWNRKVENPNETLLGDVGELYKRMGLPFDGTVVRWDVPATLLDRVRASMIFGRIGTDDPRGFERKLTLGFKLLSGHFAHNITKDEIATLAAKPGLAIPWSTRDFDELVTRVISGLLDVNALKFWNSWNLSLLGATSDAVALNYLLLTIADWQRLGEPTVPGAGATRKFARNAVVLLDRSVFEYVSGDWRGSSDSRIASNLSKIGNWTVAEPVSDDRWAQLMDAVVDDGVINDQPYASRIDPRIVTLLYYRNVILERLGPSNPAVGIHVDHIIPRTQFETEQDAQLKANMHHIANLALLPAKENQQKSGRQLVQVSDPYLRQTVAVFEDIDPSDFATYSSSASSMGLRATRGSLIKADLTTKRSQMLGKYT